MIIDLTSVGNNPKTIKHTFDPGEIDLSGEDLKLTKPVRIEGEVSRSGVKTKLDASIRTVIELDCTRCLEPVTSDLDVTFESAFVDSVYEDSRTELEVGLEDLDESLVDSGDVDLAEIAREQILLALPIQNFCREDCKGLCPKCGTNLNLIDCKCSDDEIDPRWEALKGLK
jgi:uncharacterized protein